MPLPQNRNRCFNSDEASPGPAQLNLVFDHRQLRDVVEQTLNETFAMLDWPNGRICLTEEEAAIACGVGRHVLRDLRLAGKISASRLGKRWVYRRQDLIDFLDVN